MRVTVDISNDLKAIYGGELRWDRFTDEKSFWNWLWQFNKSAPIRLWGGGVGDGVLTIHRMSFRRMSNHRMSIRRMSFRRMSTHRMSVRLLIVIPPNVNLPNVISSNVKSPNGISPNGVAINKGNWCWCSANWRSVIWHSAKWHSANCRSTKRRVTGAITPIAHPLTTLDPPLDITGLLLGLAKIIQVSSDVTYGHQIKFVK